MALSSCGAEWDFMEDELVLKAIDDAAHRFTRLFEGADFEDARQDAILYLVEHPVILRNYRANGSTSSLYQNIYSHALRNPAIRGTDVDEVHYGEMAAELGESDEQTIGIMSRQGEAPGTPGINVGYYLSLCKTEEERERVMDVIDKHLGEDGDTYTKDKIRQIVGLIFAPSMLGSWANPFGARPVDPSDARKSKGDPSHRYTDVAELADIRSAYDSADLTDLERRALLLRFAVDMTVRGASAALGVGKSAVNDAELSAVAKLYHEINGKGRYDLPA